MIDWKAFKETKFAIKCTTEKDKFFAECEKNGIFNFMNDGAMARNYFHCRLCYADRFSNGRYELFSDEEWQLSKEHGLFGSQGLEVIEYET